MTCEEVQRTLQTSRPADVSPTARLSVSLHIAECVLCSTFLGEMTAAEGGFLSPTEKIRCDKLAREYLKEMLDEPGDDGAPPV